MNLFTELGVFDKLGIALEKKLLEDVKGEKNSWSKCESLEKYESKTFL